MLFVVLSSSSGGRSRSRPCCPELQEQSFNCSSKQEVSGKRGCGGEGVQWVQLRKERERGREDKERESK